MKKIALFGATGQTGSRCLERALADGHEVVALARSPEKIQTRSPHLRVVQGDVLVAGDVEDVVKGADVVLSLFGQVKGSPARLQTTGTQHIVKAMKKHGVERIISLSGGGLPYPEKDEPKFMDSLIRGLMKLMVPDVLADAVAHHGVLEQSGTDWTIVRGPRLTNDPGQGSYRVGWVGVNASIKISRDDLADFIMSQLEDRAYIHQMPFVSR